MGGRGLNRDDRGWRLVGRHTSARSLQPGAPNESNATSPVWMERLRNALHNVEPRQGRQQVAAGAASRELFIDFGVLLDIRPSRCRDANPSGAVPFAPHSNTPPGPV